MTNSTLTWQLKDIENLLRRDTEWKNGFTDLNSGRSAVLQNYLGKTIILRLRKEPENILPKNSNRK